MSIFDSSTRDQRRHTKELEMLQPDAAVQLDGSEWARLANQRLHRERHPHQTHDDLLTSPQAIKNLIDHRPSKTAVGHWFCPIAPTYQSPVDPINTKATELLNTKRLGEVLANVDEGWVASAEGKTTDAPEGEFWSADSSEYFESRPPAGNVTWVRQGNTTRRATGSFKAVDEHRA